jgi:hypothetical protein
MFRFAERAATPIDDFSGRVHLRQVPLHPDASLRALYERMVEADTAVLRRPLPCR